MSLIDRFKKLVGNDQVGFPASNYENLRRFVVRDGNLDWQGLPIDRNRDGETPVMFERPRAFSERVREFLGLGGASIEQRWSPDVATWRPSQFENDAATTETACERAMSGRRIETNTDGLK